MERIDYKIGAKIAETFPLNYRFYRTLRYMFFDMNGLAMFLHLYRSDLEPLLFGYVDEDDQPLPYRSPVSYHVAYLVLQHIAARTLRYRKPFEFVRYKDLTNGIPGIFIPPIYYKSTMIKRALGYLTATEILIKLSLPWSAAKTSLYGLNLPHIWVDLESMWGRALLEEERVRKGIDLDTWTHERRVECWEYFATGDTESLKGTIYGSARAGEPRTLQEMFEEHFPVMLTVEPLYSYLRIHATKPIKNIDSLCAALEKIADNPDDFRNTCSLKPMHQ